MDPWNVTRQHYVSKAVAVVPLVGYASPELRGLNGTWAFFPILIVFALLIVSMDRK